MRATDFFHPGPRCGNCRSYSSDDDGYHSGSFCRKGLDPETCGDAFKTREHVKKPRRIKPWQR